MITDNVESQLAFVVVYNKSAVAFQDCSIINNSFEMNSTKQFSYLIMSIESTILMSKTSVTSTHSYMTGNILYVLSSNLIVRDCKFMHNFGQNYTIFIRENNVTSIHRTSITHNHVATDGLIVVIDSANVDLRGLNISENEGDFLITRSMVVFSGITFTSNNGSLIAVKSLLIFYSNRSASVFTKCTPDMSHEGGSIISKESKVHLYGTTHFIDNYSYKNGGAIYATDSKISMYGKTVFSNNRAEESGGGVYLYKSELNCYFNCTFYQNKAKLKGGGIHALDSKIIAEVEFLKEYQKRYLLFSKNSAKYGGAIHIGENSKIGLLDNGLRSLYKVTFTDNAAYYGGALYIDDNISNILCPSHYTVSSVCESRYYDKHSTTTECFLMAFLNQNYRNETIEFSRNSALISGSSIFGGLLDRCTVNPTYTEEDPLSLLKPELISKRFSGISFLQGLSNIKISQISSPPVRICYCSTYNRPNCSLEYDSFSLQRGKHLPLYLAVVDQVNHTVNGTVHIVISSLKEFDSVKQSHDVPNTCTHLTVRLSMTYDPKDISLYAVGPCNSSGISERKIKILLSECTCPIGFTPEENVESCECRCDPILSKYNIKDCILATESIIRETDAWIGYVNSTTYSGYLAYPNCPFDYCRPANPPLSINLNVADGSDAQCGLHRTGILCGRCKPGYSLSLSGTVCLSCPKYWSGLLVANLIAQVFTGLLLVGLTFLLDTTVAVGTFNGLIFYANFISANKSNYLPFTKPNLVTIFISFLNLESGFARCHIKDMDAYTATWVSLIYPLYINSLVVLVIIISHYSSLFSRIIARGNPVAALATLILLSYTRILRTIIDILAFAILKYPDGSTQVVWLSDASVKYLRGKHIPLFLTGIIIVTIGIVYTVLLFSWQWLLRAPHYKILSWIRNTKLNSFMDAYLAPHTVKHRHWTGLLLFARVILYLLSAVNMSGDPSFNLLVIGTIVSCLILLQLYSRSRIYKNAILDGFETTSYFNLLLFTLMSFYYIENKIQQGKVAYVSISVAFVMFWSGVLYHVVLSLRKSQCTNHIRRYFKHKIQQRRQNHGSDLQVNLIDKGITNEMTNVFAPVPSCTVVSVSPDHKTD